MKNTWKKSLLLCVSAGLFAGTICKFFIIDILHISGSSMEPSLADGDAVVVCKLSYGLVKPFSDSLFFSWAEPQENDVVIYLHDNRLVIKRCVAVGNTPLDYSCDKGYTLIVNGHTYPLSEEQFSSFNYIATVPDGTILAIGDNQASSIDSRAYGFIPVYNILGKALCK